MKPLVRLLACLHLPLMPTAPSLAGDGRPLARAHPPGLAGALDAGAAAAATPAPAATGPDAEDLGACRCGWFDSSHDLQQGLLVQEHLSPDSLAHELPLDAWLALHLAGWQPSRLEQPLP